MSGVCPPSTFCELDAALFHLAEGTAGGTGLLTVSDAECSDIVGRSGELLFGCPGDPFTAAQVGAPDGTVGAGGALPVSIRFSSPRPAMVASASEVRYTSASSETGVAAGVTVGTVWSTGSSLAGVVAPGLAAAAVAFLAVVLVSRWVRRTRRSI